MEVILTVTLIGIGIYTGILSRRAITLDDDYNRLAEHYYNLRESNEKLKERIRELETINLDKEQLLDLYIENDLLHSTRRKQ